MNSHLSEEQISEWIAGQRSGEAGRHVRECSECAAEVAHTGSALLLFRDSGFQCAEYWLKTPAATLPRRRAGWVAVSTVIAAAIIAVVTFGESDMRPKFVAADVHATPVGAMDVLSRDRLRTIPVHADRYELKNATMVDMIGIAWGFQNDKIVGGPNWLEMDRFDVTAKLPGDTSPDYQKRMLQTLLEDRFKLVVHKDTKPVPGYALTAVGKPALKAANGSEKSGCGPSSAPGGIASWGSVDGGPTVNYTIGPGSTITYNCRNVTMDAFVQGLRSMMGTNLGPGPVLDETGLKGAWNFDLSWTLDFVYMPPGSSPVARVTFLDALDRQLGLKLEERQVPAPALVVDGVNRTPTANALDLDRVMPPIPPLTRFEVASVKRSDPGSTRSGFRIQPGGRLTMEGFTMDNLFQFTFSGGQIEKMPNWAGSDRFDIAAKTPPGAEPLDRTNLGSPLLTLLKDRFRLAYHTEQRPGNAYVIEAAKPKMKKADPASRSWCKRDMAPYGSQGKSIRFACQNITMAQFADWLEINGIGLTSRLVSDGTGLNGTWDFTLIYNPEMSSPMPPAADGASPSGGVPTASDPATGYSIFEAFERQLGLKLETTKGLRPVVVIDHIEEKPVDQ